MTESLVHADLKYDLYWSLLTDDYASDIEQGIGRTRTDVTTEINGTPLAIEIQYTAISKRDILKRMREHTAGGYHTLWLIPEATLLKASSGIRNLGWVMFIQRLQEGVIFLPHTDGSHIIPARIDNSLMFSKGDVWASRKKIIDKQEPIGLDEITFKVNYDLNVSTTTEWWLESYQDYLS